MNINHLSGIADTWQIDTETGEVMGMGISGANTERYSPPIVISSIKSRGVYEEIIREKTSRRKYVLRISPLLLDVIIAKEVSIPAISVLCSLGRKIGYNNMVYTTSRELSIDSKYSRQGVSMAITELKKAGFIKEPNGKVGEKGDRFLLINPLYFFLGYYPYRDNLIRDWIA